MELSLGQTSDGLNGAGGTFDIDQTSTGTINLDPNGASANVSIEQTSTGTVNMDVDGASFTLILTKIMQVQLITS